MTKRKTNPLPRGGARPGAGRKRQYLRSAIPIGVPLRVMHRGIETKGIISLPMGDYPDALLRLIMADNSVLEIANTPTE